MTALRDALIGLDPSNDTQWTKAGLPALNHLEGVTGEPVTRAAVDALLPNDANREGWAGALDAMATVDGVKIDETVGIDPALLSPATDPDPASIASAAGILDDAYATGDAISYEPTVSSVVQVTTAEPHDGAETSAAIVVKVNDDGSVNLRVFSANGGADGFLSGVKYRDLTGDEDQPLPFWEWPY